MTNSVTLHPDHELAARVANTKRLDLLARDRILKLLSDTELAQVSSAEESTKLAANDEYIDLEHLEHGVRRTPVVPAEAARMLPRSAVSDATWGTILTVLDARTT